MRFDETPFACASRITLTHAGLNSQSECFGMCSQGWDYYVAKSLGKQTDDRNGLRHPEKTERDNKE